MPRLTRKPAKRKVSKLKPEDDMKRLYNSLTRGRGHAAIVGWGDQPMTYLGEGVYLKADGTMHCDK